MVRYCVFACVRIVNVFCVIALCVIALGALACFGFVVAWCVFACVRVVNVFCVIALYVVDLGALACFGFVVAWSVFACVRIVKVFCVIALCVIAFLLWISAGCEKVVGQVFSGFVSILNSLKICILCYNYIKMSAWKRAKTLYQ